MDNALKNMMGEASDLRVGQAPEKPGEAVKAVRFTSGGDTLQIASSNGPFLLNGENMCLTQKESELFVALAQRAGEVCSRAELGEALYGNDHKSHKRSIDTYVKNLRAKFGDDSTRPHWIETIQGVGYRFIGHKEEAE